jgi:hypothetical protein
MGKLVRSFQCKNFQEFPEGFAVVGNVNINKIYGVILGTKM